jgi:hypothetical protein
MKHTPKSHIAALKACLDIIENTHPNVVTTEIAKEGIENYERLYRSLNSETMKMMEVTITKQGRGDDTTFNVDIATRHHLFDRVLEYIEEYRFQKETATLSPFLAILLDEEGKNDDETVRYAPIPLHVIKGIFSNCWGINRSILEAFVIIL